MGAEEVNAVIVAIISPPIPPVQETNAISQFKWLDCESICIRLFSLSLDVFELTLWLRITYIYVLNFCRYYYHYNII